MPRVIGIDPGTVSIDLCGLDDGQLFLDRSTPTARALADPAGFVALLEQAGPLDLVAGPSGYGLPLTRVQDATDEDLRLAFLAAPGESGGIGGLAALVRALARSTLPVVLTPGVLHLPTVPEHRKVNRVDMGTAEKVCAVALAIDEQARRLARPLAQVSLVLLELGGAFTAAVAVAGGGIVDGMGGSSGPLGFRAAGALDGEVAYLAGDVSKTLLFGGGVARDGCARRAAGPSHDGARARRLRGAHRERREGGYRARDLRAVTRGVRAVGPAGAGGRRTLRDPAAARTGRAHARACRVRADRQSGGPGRGAHRRRPRGRDTRRARRDAGDPRGARHGARSSVRRVPRAGATAPGAVVR